MVQVPKTVEPKGTTRMKTIVCSAIIIAFCFSGKAEVYYQNNGGGTVTTVYGDPALGHPIEWLVVSGDCEVAGLDGARDVFSRFHLSTETEAPEFRSIFLLRNAH